ncbi:MAG TPA: TonB family protein [Acidobacteriaceae bacterium]|nr:TonB family protein [Acidobacteriaceae bacterium]
MPIRVTPTEPLDPTVDEFADESESQESSDSTASDNPSNGDGPRLPLRRSRYEGLDHTDLLHVIDELEGNRGWASLREKLWIALIIHMLVAWYLFYGPKYIYHVRVVDPSVIMKQRQKDLTFLDLPPDALKKVRPKPTNIISDKDRTAQAQHPTIDRKTLQELEAMRRAGPPVPAPAPPPSQQKPAPSPLQPEVAQQKPPTPPAQPLPQNNQAHLEAPPMAPQPNFRSGAAADPNQQLQQAMRQAMQGRSGQYGGDMGQGAPSQHQGMQGAVDILSDTMGVDFGPYIQRVIWDTKRAWYPIIPEEARSPINKQGKVLIRFRILPDGSVESMQLESPSGDVALDRSAWAGITGASPFPPLPKAFKGPFLELRFYFLYNIAPSDE